MSTTQSVVCNSTERALTILATREAPSPTTVGKRARSSFESPTPGLRSASPGAVHRASPIDTGPGLDRRSPSLFGHHKTRRSTPKEISDVLSTLATSAVNYKKQVALLKAQNKELRGQLLSYRLRDGETEANAESDDFVQPTFDASEQTNVFDLKRVLSADEEEEQQTLRAKQVEFLTTDKFSEALEESGYGHLINILNDHQMSVWLEYIGRYSM
jgi:hypothetical protein